MLSPHASIVVAKEQRRRAHAPFQLTSDLPYEGASLFMTSYTDPAIRITLLPRDTNSRGTIFGGIILSYIDMAGAIEAHRRTKMARFVTVAMREVIFHQPVFVGDLVSFYAEITRVGTTSVTIRVIVEAERHSGTSEESVRVTEAEVVYVAVDDDHRKVRVNRDFIGEVAGES